MSGDQISEGLCASLDHCLSWQRSTLPRTIDLSSRNLMASAAAEMRAQFQDNSSGIGLSMYSRRSQFPINLKPSEFRNPETVHALLSSRKSSITSTEKSRGTGDFFDGTFGLEKKVTTHTFLDFSFIEIRSVVGVDTALEYARQIMEALSVIRKVSPATYSFVLRFSSQITILEYENLPRFTSASNNAYHRKMCLVNLAKLEYGILEILDSIVHEAIHSFLYSVELFFPFTDKAHDKPDLILSPWTGRRLSAHSFAHACFVWSALGMFWKKYHSCSQTTSSSSFLYDRARSGFSGRAQANNVRAGEHALDRTIFAHISGMSV